MSFFFDVWTSKGFILASDVRIMINGAATNGHKLARAATNSKVNCAIAVCGDYPDNCLNYFREATMTKDTLREIAHAFAKKWTERYSGTQEYSAVHIVGFEKIPNFETTIPQMWFWCNWQGRSANDYYSKEALALALNSFSEPVPHNNHIPYKIRELTEKFPGSDLKDELQLVTAFLKEFEPFFTWNGDTAFWRSALGIVDSAMSLLKKEKITWSIDEVSRLTSYCLGFLANTGTLLEFSTVGFTGDHKYDMIQVTPSNIETLSWADIK
jgi:hypothetical protein